MPANASRRVRALRIADAVGYDHAVRILPAVLIMGACGRIDFVQVMPRDDAPVSTPDVASVDPIGCSDGEREGYLDLTTYPTIAACSATWTTELDLRAAPTGGICGDEAGPCVAPADACSVGWHICATSGDVSELLVLSAADCVGLLSGRYVAASDHCLTATPSCSYDAPGSFQCLPGENVDCTQSICCGTSCDTTNICENGVWSGETHENAPNGAGCASTPGTSQDGVLCCKG